MNELPASVVAFCYFPPFIFPVSSPETIILRQLLAATGGFVSGNTLADLLGVSRVSVWSHMEKLRSHGFDFEARPRLGYRIRTTPVGLCPLFLQALLPPEWQDIPLHFHQTIDSTNSEAERLLATNSAVPFAVLARAQTKGRGRLGRPWASADHGNLYLSVAFQPRLPPQRMQTFTLWMGATLCHFLNQRENIPVRVKWPNDLMLKGKKLGGMLTEARIDQDHIRDLVFGLGLNVNGQPDALPPEVRAIATSLASASGRPLCLNRFTAALLAQIFHTYRDFTHGRHDEPLRDLWRRYDALSGLPVATRQGDRRFSGTARGIDDQGHLLLEQADGSLYRVNAGDVTLEKD